MSEYQDYTIAMPMPATPSRKMDTIVHVWVAFLETEHPEGGGGGPKPKGRFNHYYV